MPIDLNFQASPVSSFAKRNPQGEAQKATGLGNAFAGAFQKGQQVVDEWEQFRTERDIRQTTLKLSDMASVQAEGYKARFYYSGEELEGTEYKGQKYEKGPDGLDVPKEIPAWEAEPYIRKRDSLENLQNASAGIEHYTARQEFIARGKLAIDSQFQSDMQNAKREAILATRYEEERDIAEFARNGDFGAAIDTVENSLVFNTEEKKARSEGLAKGSEIFAVREISIVPEWSAKEFADAELQIDYLGDDEAYRGSLTKEERIALINELKSRMAQETARVKSGSWQVNAAWVMEVEERISNRDPAIGASFLLQGITDGHIKGPRAISLFNKVRKNIEEDQQWIKLKDSVIGAVERGSPIPLNNESRGVVDRIFNDRIAELKRQSEMMGTMLTPAQEIGVSIAHAKAYNVVPSSTVDILAGMERGEPKDILEGALAYNELIRVAPESARDFTNKGFDTVENTASALRRGMTEAEALKSGLFIRNADKTEREALAVISKDWTSQTNTKEAPLLTTLRQKMGDDPVFDDWFWQGDARPTGQALGFGVLRDGVTPEMYNQYQMLFNDYLRTTGGQPTDAAEKAYTALKGTYGVTDINYPLNDALAETVNDKYFAQGRRKEIMAFPPTVGLGSNAAISSVRIRNDIATKFKASLREGELLAIHSDAETRRQGQSNSDITYPIYAIHEDGGERVVGRWWVNTMAIEESWEGSIAQKQLDDEQEAIEKSILEEKLDSPYMRLNQFKGF